MKHEIEFLIIGQGIGGILIAFELWKMGKSFLVIDDGSEKAASLAAGAILNPVNLNKWHLFEDQKTNWNISLKTYHELEFLLKERFLIPLKFYFFPENDFKKIPEEISFVSKPDQKDINMVSEIFNNPGDALEISDVYRVDIHRLKSAWKKFLSQKGIYIQTDFHFSDCAFKNNSVEYGGYIFQKIIFAEGARGIANPYFHDLPFIRNLGNVLHLKIENMPREIGFHSDKEKLIPMGEGRFWFGSNYEWSFNELLPDIRWQNECFDILKRRLKIPFQITEHFVAERPTTIGQKPIMIQSKEHPELYMFNGLGTRGFTVAPVLAKEFYGKYFGNKQVE